MNKAKAIIHLIIATLSLILFISFKDGLQNLGAFIVGTYIGNGIVMLSKYDTK